MKRLITQSTLCAAILAAGVVQSGVAQEIEIVARDALTNYLWTIKDVGGTISAVDPNTDGNFAVHSIDDPVNGSFPIWAFKEYVQQPVSGNVWTGDRNSPGASHTLNWSQDTGPFYYGGINFYNNTVTPASATELFGAAVARGDLPAGTGEGEADGQKITQYFRTPFTTTEAYDSLLLESLVDDAFVMYIDGVEVERIYCCQAGDGVPYFDGRTINDGDYNNANSPDGGNEDGPRFVGGLDLSGFGGTLPAGDHVLAYSVHSYGAWTSSDLVADMRVFTTTEENQWALEGGGRWQDGGSWTVQVSDGVGVTGNLWGNNTGPSTVYNNSADFTLGTLSFDSANTYAVAGHGTLNFDSGDESSSVVVLQGNHEMQLQVSLNNDVDVDVASGSVLEFNNTVTTNGHQLNTVGGGDVMINNLLITDAAVAAAAGVLGGDGIIQGDLINEGANVTPGHSPGTLTVLGDYTQNPDGTLTVEIGGELASIEHDVLVVGGTASLAGTLEVDLINDHMPSLGDQYQIIVAGNFDGSFDDIVLPNDMLAPYGLAFDASNVSLNGMLTVVPEPASAMMLLFGSLLLWARRRK